MLNIVFIIFTSEVYPYSYPRLYSKILGWAPSLYYKNNTKSRNKPFPRLYQWGQLIWQPGQKLLVLPAIIRLQGRLARGTNARLCKCVDYRQQSFITLAPEVLFVGSSMCLPLGLMNKGVGGEEWLQPFPLSETTKTTFKKAQAKCTFCDQWHCYCHFKICFKMLKYCTFWLPLKLSVRS